MKNLLKNSILVLIAISAIIMGSATVLADVSDSVDLYETKPVVYSLGSLAYDNDLYLSVYSTPSQANITLNVSADAGIVDADIYNSWGDWESAANVDLSSEDVGLTVSEDQGDFYYVVIHADSAVTNLVVTVDYTSDSNTAEVIDFCDENPAQRTNITSPSWDYRFITIYNVPAGEDLTVDTSGGTGDVDLYVYDLDYNDYCDSDNNLNGNGTEEQCVISSAYGGSYMVELDGNDVYSGVTIDANVSDPGACAPTYPETTILNGEGGTTGEITDTNYEYFKINVPSGASNLSVTTSGGTGTSADLYHKYNAQPTTADYDNSSVTSGTNSESITIASPTAGDHYFGVYANGGTVNGVNITADFTNGSLSKGVDKTGINLSENEWQHYTFSVPSGATDLTLTTSGGSGNVDLYTRYNAYPTTSTNDGSDTGAGTARTVVISSPTTPGTYTVSVRGGTGGASNITLNADYTPAPGVLYNGKTETGISGGSGEWNYYTIDTPSGSPMLKIVMKDEGANNVEAQLYERLGANPTTGTYDNADIEAGNDGSITINNPTAGTHHIGVYCNPSGSDCGPVSLTAYYVVDELDLDGGSASNIAVTQPNAWTYYTTHVPFSNYDQLIVETTGGTSPSGDVDLYMDFGSFPTTSAYHFISADDNDYTESVSTDPNGGTYFIGLYGSPTFSDIDLTVNMSEGTWVLDNIAADGYASAVAIDSNSADYDFAVASDGSNTWFYKRNGRDWAKMNPTAGLGFGSSAVGISEDQAYATNGGNIVMYTRTDNTWSSAGTVASGELADAAGDLVVSTRNNGGIISIYNCAGGTCSSYGTIADPGEANGESWGSAIATDGNKIVVGDPGYDKEPHIIENIGKVYVYVDSGGGNWSLEDSFYPADYQGDENFGVSVDIDGSQLVVGALYGFITCDSCGTYNGTVYVYTESGGSWSQQQELEHSDGTFSEGSNGDHFGQSVAIQGNYLIASAPRHNGGPGHTMGLNGRAYIFEKSGVTWSQIISYGADSGFGLGDDVAITGNWYYAIAGNTSGSGPGLVILNNNPTGADGDGPGGGGSAVPEFSDYVLILAIAITIFFMFKTIPKMGGRPIGKA